MKKIVPIILSVMAAGCVMIGCDRSFVLGGFNVAPGVGTDGYCINKFAEEFTGRVLYSRSNKEKKRYYLLDIQHYSVYLFRLKAKR